MTKGYLLGFAAVTALMLSAVAPSFAKGGGHGGGHGGHGGGHHAGHGGGHGHHVGHAGHAHAAAHIASHVHYNAGFAHHTGRHFAANHASAHNYAGWNHGAWNHYGWNHGWRNGWTYGNRGWWGRRYGVWNAGYWGGAASSYLPYGYGYGVADRSYYYQYYNNVTVPNVYPSITTLSQTGGSNAIEAGALTMPPAPADAQPDVCDSSVADSTIPTPVAPAGPSATE